MRDLRIASRAALIIQRIRVALQLALVVLLLEIVAWLVSIGASS